MKPNARAIALDALLRVEQDGAFLDRVLPAMFDRYVSSNEDCGLAMEFATGVPPDVAGLISVWHLIRRAVSRSSTQSFC